MNLSSNTHLGILNINHLLTATHTDEYNAYKRGELFGGDCYSQMKIQSMYPKLKETRATEKQQLENMSDIGRQKIASQYKTAFRVKGKTYRY